MEKKECAKCVKLDTEASKLRMPANLFTVFLVLGCFTLFIWATPPQENTHPVVVWTARMALSAISAGFGVAWLLWVRGKMGYYHKRLDGSLHDHLTLPTADMAKEKFIEHPLWGMRRGAVLFWRTRHPDDELCKDTSWKVWGIGKGGIRLRHLCAPNCNYEIGLFDLAPLLLKILEEQCPTGNALRILPALIRSHEEHAGCKEKLRVASEVEAEMGKALTAIYEVSKDKSGVGNSIYGRVFAKFVHVVLERIGVTPGYGEDALTKWARDNYNGRAQIMYLVEAEKNLRGTKGKQRAEPSPPSPGA